MTKEMKISSKHALISKNNTRIVFATAAASALAVFALVGGHSMIARMSYLRHVTGQQRQAINQLNDDQTSLDALVNQYSVFANANPNILGVSSSGTSGDEGSNARIVLDALPSEYDFPALATSIEKILSARGLPPQGIGGSDTSSTTGSVAPSANPQPQTIQFNFSATSTYQNIKDLLSDFQRSIRPFKITSLDLSGSNSKLTVAASVDTYYQPSKTLGLSVKVVK